MAQVGPSGFFLFMAILFAALAIYTVWRMGRRRQTPDVSGGFAPLTPSVTAVGVEAALETRQND